MIPRECKRLQKFKNCIIIDMDQTCMPYSSLTTLRRILVGHPRLNILAKHGRLPRLSYGDEFHFVSPPFLTERCAE